MNHLAIKLGYWQGTAVPALAVVTLWSAHAGAEWSDASDAVCASKDVQPFVEAHPMGKHTGRSVVREHIKHVGDLDGDGDLDVVSLIETNNGGHYVAGWHKNLGKGKFTFKRISKPGWRKNTEIAVADMDGDGDLDIVHGNRHIDEHWPGGLSIYENVGKAKAWKERVLLEKADPVRGLSRAVFVADLDGDGKPDIIYYDNDKDSYRWMSNGKWNKSIPLGTLNSKYTVLGAHDFDGNGAADLFYLGGAPYGFGWLKNTNKGRAFKPMLLDSTKKASPDRVMVDGVTAIALDFEGDGDMDIVAGEAESFYYGITLYENVDGEGTFAAMKIVDPAKQKNYTVAGHVDTADLDGDGSPEVVVGEMQGDKMGLLIFSYDEAKGACVRAEALPNMLRKAIDLRIADMDGDGDLDVVYSGKWTNAVWIENSTK